MAKIWRFTAEAENLLNGQKQVVHIHYQTDVPLVGSEPSAADVLDFILDHFSTAGHNMSIFAGSMFSPAKLTRAVVREELDPSSGAIPAVAEETLSIVGTQALGAADATPSGLTIWLAFRTGTASRSARGGTHWFGPYNVNMLDSVGKWDTAGGVFLNLGSTATVIAQSMSNVFDSTGDINPVVYSRTRRGRGQSPFVFPITAVPVSSEPRWLRRRSPA